MRDILNTVPTVVLALVAMVVAVGLVVAGVLLVRRFVPGTREGFDAEVSSQMLGVVVAMFGLLLAFVVVVQFQNFGNAQQSVSEEAGALAAMVRDANTLPPPQRERVRAAVGAYVRAVVDDEWPRMRDGHDDARAWRGVDGIYAALQAARPASADAPFYDDAVHQLNAALIARRERLAAVEPGLPALMTLLLITGTVVILGYATLVGSRNVWFHAIGAGSLALILAFSLVVLADLSYPFCGDLAVAPSDFHSGALAGLSHGP